MKHLLGLGLMVGAVVFGADQYTGDYQGTLVTPGPSLKLVLHLRAAAQGGYSATLDSVDQGANGIPVASAKVLADGALSLDLPALHGKYEGKFSQDASTIDGTWTQGQSLPLKFSRMAVGAVSSAPAKPTVIDGNWHGTIEAGGAKLRVVFHFSNTADGIKGTLDSPDQSTYGLPLTAALDGSTVNVTIPSARGQFSGTVSADQKKIEGKWSQGGAGIPLTLERGTGTAANRVRPRDPKKPYPYQSIEVSVPNKGAGIELAGTLTIPEGKGPFPSVVLITGSGPQNRDEELMGHRPFLVLADYLTRKGIAVLRMDDRGVGKSGGKFAGSTTMDFATDAEAGVAFLKTRPELNPTKIGLIGHSEGGLIAPIGAARSKDVAFIVMLAGPGQPGDEIIVEQTVAMAKASGSSGDRLAEVEAKEREFVRIVKSEKDDTVLKQRVKDLLGAGVPDSVLQTSTSAWYRSFLNTDPRPYLKQVKCPVLALIGSKDLQVPATDNIPAIRAALTAGGNREFEVVEVPGVNHLFQTATTGLLREYAEIDETMSPAVLEKIASWLAKR